MILAFDKFMAKQNPRCWIVRIHTQGASEVLYGTGMIVTDTVEITYAHQRKGNELERRSLGGAYQRRRRFQSDTSLSRYIFELSQPMHGNLPEKGERTVLIYSSTRSIWFTRTNRILEKISMESKLYGSMVRASSQQVRASCNSRSNKRVSEVGTVCCQTSSCLISFGLQEKNVSWILKTNLC